MVSRRHPRHPAEVTTGLEVQTWIVGGNSQTSHTGAKLHAGGFQRSGPYYGLLTLTDLGAKYSSAKVSIHGNVNLPDSGEEGKGTAVVRNQIVITVSPDEVKGGAARQVTLH